MVHEFYVEPDFPDGTAEDEESGIVVLKVVVRADGTVAETVTLRSRPEGRGFAEAAAAAVGQWRFQPATKDGVPVAASFTLRLPFALSRPE
jgi:protein TonB